MKTIKQTEPREPTEEPKEILKQNPKADAHVVTEALELFAQVRSGGASPYRLTIPYTRRVNDAMPQVHTSRCIPTRGK